MKNSAPLFRWSRLVPGEELEEWENRMVIAGIAYSAEWLTGRERWRICAFATSREEAEEWKSRFGGGVVKLEEEDWTPTTGHEGGRILRIRDSLVVTDCEDEDRLAEIREEFADRVVLSFPPQLAFGTGDHPTTAGCLRFLADWAAARGDRPWRFLDLGCGSGILSVAAAKLGAEKVVAVDNDGMALGFARKNAERHGAGERVEFVEGDVLGMMEDPPWGPQDLVAANLFSSLLVRILADLDGHVSPGAGIVLSGFLTTQTREVAEAAKAAGFPLVDFLRRGKWVAGRSDW